MYVGLLNKVTFSFGCGLIWLQVPGSNYAAVMTTAAAEVPAVVWAAAVSKGYGGHTALVSSLVLGCACLLPSIIGSMLPAGKALLLVVVLSVLDDYVTHC